MQSRRWNTKISSFNLFTWFLSSSERDPSCYCQSLATTTPPAAKLIAIAEQWQSWKDGVDWSQTGTVWWIQEGSQKLNNLKELLKSDTYLFHFEQIQFWSSFLLPASLLSTFPNRGVRVAPLRNHSPVQFRVRAPGERAHRSWTLWSLILWKWQTLGPRWKHGSKRGILQPERDAWDGPIPRSRRGRSWYGGLWWCWELIDRWIQSRAAWNTRESNGVSSLLMAVQLMTLTFPLPLWGSPPDFRRPRLPLAFYEFACRERSTVSLLWGRWWRDGACFIDGVVFSNI